MAGNIQPAAPVPVRVVRRFDMSAEQVFDAWLDTAAIGKWMFGPALREEEVLGLSIDPMVNGKVHLRR